MQQVYPPSATSKNVALVVVVWPPTSRAAGEGFEPSDELAPSAVFKTAPFGRSGTPPRVYSSQTVLSPGAARDDAAGSGPGARSSLTSRPGRPPALPCGSLSFLRPAAAGRVEAPPRPLPR